MDFSAKSFSLGNLSLLTNFQNLSWVQWRSYILANVAKTKGGRLVGAAKCDDFFVLSEQTQSHFFILNLKQTQAKMN